MSVNILIIDSEFLTSRSLSQQLVQRGCSVSEADGLVQANQKIRSRRFDVALVALGSLKEEALLVIQNIKNNCPETEIIILTQQEYLSLSIQGMKLGAFDDIMVPIDVEELLSKISAAQKKNQRFKY